MAGGTIQRNTLTRGTEKKNICFEYVLSDCLLKADGSDVRERRNFFFNVFNYADR